MTPSIWAHLLGSLAARRAVFHSEADFQHSLAWLIQETWPDSEIRLEMPVATTERRIYLDIYWRRTRDVTAIELKYTTKAAALAFHGEAYELRGHFAQGLRRYNFLRDIQRLEAFQSAQPNVGGIALFLTNDPGYWTPALKPGSIDAAFRLEEGRTVAGLLNWARAASARSMKGREEPIRLLGEYRLTWRDYSSVADSRNGAFRYLLAEVSNLR